MIDNFIECSQSISHLIILSSDKSRINIRLVQTGRLTQTGRCRISQSPGFTQFLEYDRIHTSPEILVI